jgi:WD40 repeat protein
MRMQSIFLLIGAVAGMVSATAQTGGLRFPALGFAPDSRSGQIRSIRGIPGAALLGDPIATASAFSAAAISPQQDLVLAVSSADSQVYLVPLTGSAPRAVPGAMSAPSHLVFSPSGRAAVIWGTGIEILTELAGTPRVTEVAAGPFAAPAAAALSDDGQVVLASSAQDDTPVWLAGPGGDPVQLALPGSVATIAFRRDSHDAVAITRSGDLYLIRNAGPDAEIHQVYLGNEQTSDPVAVQVSPDGTRAFTANARGTVAVIDLGTGSAAAVSCQCSPTGLEPLNATSLFRLTEISDRPVMLFDASTSTPRIWFVPADAPPAGLQGSAQ